MIYGKNVKEAMYEGMMEMVEVVSKTLGPSGKNIIIDGRKTFISSDGLTVAKAISFDDTLKNIGCALLVNGAEITKDLVGDGTTSTIILALEFIKNCKSGWLDDNINEDLDLVLNDILSKLDELAFDVNDPDMLNDVAYTSSNDERIAQAVSKAILEVKEYGYIGISPGYHSDVTYEVIKGISYEKGYISSYLASDGKVILRDAIVLIVNDALAKITELEDLISDMKKTKNDLLIIALSYSKEVIDYIIFLKKSYDFNICATLAPEYGEIASLYLDDLAIYLDTNIITTKTVYNNIDNISRADYIEITKNHTIIRKDDVNLEKLNKRIDYLKEELNKTKDQTTVKRLAKISNGIATIYVPSIKDYEYVILKEKAFNAINSTMNCYQSRGVYGGGYTLNLVYEKLKNKVNDHSIKSLVYHEIIKSLPIIKTTIEKNKYSSNQIPANSADKHVIDSLKNTKTIVGNAMYVLKLFLSVDAVVVRKPEEDSIENLF